MTIRVRIVGAFGVVLVVLFALCTNSLHTLGSIDSEANDVELRVARRGVLAEFNGQTKVAIGFATQYVLSEKASDLEALTAALAKLKDAAATLDRQVYPLGGPDADALRRDVDGFFSGVDAVARIVKARGACATGINAAIVGIQVVVSALAERAAAYPGISNAALDIVGGAGSSAVAALRYRFSRDPADMEAARRWLDLSQHRLAALAQAPSEDRRLARFADVLGKDFDGYKRGLDELETDTRDFSRASKDWNEAAARLLARNVAARDANSAAQSDAVARTKAAIGVGSLFDKSLGVLAVIVAMLLAGWLVKNIAAPIVSITEAMRRIAAGELDATLAEAGRVDEIGRMAAAVAVFRNGLLRVRALDGEVKDEQRQKHERITRMVALNRAFEREVGADTSSLSEAAAEMMGAARGLLDIAAQTSSRSSAVASAATGASSNVRLVAGSTEEVSTSLRAISDEVSTSTVTASDAVRRAQEADTSVQALINGAAKVGEVVGLIRSIAHETNLLALNATIEAARAGDAGRGFGVVAEEVKQLAVATGRATDDVEQQIDNIQRAMQAAAATIQEIKSSLGAMDRNTSRIAGAVEEQSSSIARITSSAAGAAAGAEQVTKNIMDVMAASRATDAAARQVLASAEGVAQRTQLMKQKVATFLTDAMAV